MKNYFTKAVSLLLALMMIVSCVPTTVLADMAASLMSNDVSTAAASPEMAGPNIAALALAQVNNGMVSTYFSPYEPYVTKDTEDYITDEHPFLQGGSAWLDLSKIYYGAPATQNYPLTKWSANTSVYNITETGNTYTSGFAKGQKIFAFRDVNMIDEFTWVGFASDERLPYTSVNGTTKYENGVVSSNGDVYHGYPILTSKNDEDAYAYNRYDAMQGKYGITLDKNVKTAVWSPSYKAGYYGSEAMFNSVVHLSDTPYLYFSTEALDSTQMAISLLIGTPVQKEILDSASDRNGTVVTNTEYYEYRWYTITDDAERPGIDYNGELSMIPNITVSDVVAVVQGVTGDKTDAYSQQSEDVLAAAHNAGKADPLAMAQAKGLDPEKMYVDGSITGCLDFTNILPLVMGVKVKDANGAPHSTGRQGVQYKVAQIRVDTKSKDGAADSACRVNYMYFGPSLSTNFTPQNTVGNTVSGQAWQYAQTSTNSVGSTDTSVGDLVYSTANTERAFTNGWENGTAVSVVNTPNTPQLLTVDTYGQGDGQLIEWSAVPAGAKVLKGNQKANDSKVWKFTDANGVVQYMEAQYTNTTHAGGIKGAYYVMVTVPVRKWINVLGESRKISMTATLLHSGQEHPTLKPAFIFWGNEAGSLGDGHSGPENGARYHNEDMIMVFGTEGQVYHTDQGQDYICAEVDRTIGDSVILNAPGGTTESWFDSLRSPYTYSQTITSADSFSKVTEDHIGYVFITSLRFAMPVGSAVSVQNMKGDGNSAGLNMYATSGTIVSAYDGGTGIQPEIDVTSNTLPEYTMTYHSSSNTYSAATLDSNGIKGTISNGAAAYGPMLLESNYTIYDLLDTEMLRATSKDSHNNTNLGKSKQPVYGQVWKSKDGSALPIYHKPSTTDGTKYGYVYGDSQFIVYSTVIFTDKNNTKWGMTGVLTKNGSTEMGWVQLYDGSANKVYCEKLSGVLYEERRMKYSEYDGWYTPRGMIAALSNSWVISDFSSIDDGADFRDGTNTNFEYTSDFRKQNNSTINMKFDPSQNVISQAYGGPQMKYANKWTGSGHYSSHKSLSDFYLRAVNGTDMEWGFKRSNNTDSNMAMAMARVRDTPIRLKQGKTIQNGSFPVLYIDYTSTTSFKIGLTLRVDGVDKLWYVYGENYIAPESQSLSSGNHYAYLSFEDIMTKDYKNASTIEVTGIALYMWNGTSVNEGNVVLRRCEIWQEETEWYDDIIADNQQAGGNTSTQMNCQVKDSMNIINDSYYNIHDEASDGEITVTKKGTYASDVGNIGINNAERGYEFTYADGTKEEALDYWEGGVNYKYDRTVSYRKENSNKGWKAYIRLDENRDGKVNENDATYYSFDAAAVDGVYQYMTSLGHLRVWVGSQTQASVVFEADRSFSTKNYKYLYYSYSMRDADTGIAAEEPDTARDDGLKPGIAVSIKANQLGSHNAYSEILDENGVRTWAYYSTDNAYWSDDGRDNRTFKTTINAALDLSTLKGIQSVNQFVFYLNNPMGTAGDGNAAEFYINYLYLSNVPPTDLIKTELEKTAVQYYYMMDNTGDRYSARFPTIDNPTGQVTGLNGDNDRVNPIVVDRGARLADGTYFNGDHLYGYGDGPRGFNENTFSDGYYEKDYGSSDGYAGSMKNILFYAGESSDLHDITDYYQYKDRDGVDTDGDGNLGEIYDMMWSYGRWYGVAGDNALNKMYIGQKTDASVGETKDQISGQLVRRYATENYVLLRSGIEPIKYLTYYDAMGGEMQYYDQDASGDQAPDFVRDTIYKHENSYYITRSAVMSYYTFPSDYMHNPAEPTKYGSKFVSWVSDTTNLDEDVETVTDTLHKYTQKKNASIDYFYAKWEDDPAYDTVVNTVTFMQPQNTSEVWYTRDANKDNDFTITLPTVSQVAGASGTIRVLGWYDASQTGDAKIVYAPGSTLTIKGDVTLMPELYVYGSSTPEDDLVISVTVAPGAKLYFVNGKSTAADKNDFTNPANYVDPVKQHITMIEDANGTTYTDLPRNVQCVIIPDTVTSGYGWQITKNDDDGAVYLNGMTQPTISTNYQYYKFNAYNDMTITYAKLANSAAEVKNSPVFTSPETVEVDRKMIFFSQYDAASIDGTVLAAGTIYTTNKYYDSLKANLAAEMTLDESTITATAINNIKYNNKATYAAKSSSVRYIQATSTTSTGQYALRATETKGNAVTYYARSYVIVEKTNGTYGVLYSDVVASSSVDADMSVSEG